MNTIKLTELRRSLGDVVNQAALAGERTTVTRNGKPLAVVVPVDDVETLEALEDRADREALDRALADDDGQRISHAELLALLDEDARTGAA